MRIISNGTMREVPVLKHFIMSGEEYVLYKNVSSVSLGLISQGKILTPPTEKISLLMQVIGNLISPTPNEVFNYQNNINVLGSSVGTPMEEVGYQDVNISEEQVNKILNIAPATPATPAVNETINIGNEPPQTTTFVIGSPENMGGSQPNTTGEVKPNDGKVDNKMKIYLIVIVVLILVLVFVVFKDKIFGKKSSSPESPTGGGGSEVVSPPMIDGIEIADGYNTYAVRANVKVNTDGMSIESNETVLRYASDGAFRYYKYTELFSVDEVYEALKDKSDEEVVKSINESECDKMEQYTYEGFQTICEVNNRIFSRGYIITDQTIAGGILNAENKSSKLEEMLKNYQEVENETKVKEWTSKKQQDLKASNGDLLIVANEKINLSN